MSGTLTRQAQQRSAPALPLLVGLDGLRAVAVAAVVLYHAGVTWLPGGFLGVDVFFVLSGFLITSLLLVELERTGRLDFGRFYLRRARRLLPALFAVLAVTGVLVATIAYDVAAAYRRDLPGALLYFSNWSAIVTDTSYFEFIGRPTMLQHLWSLAVEEQFYLLWPVLCLLLFRWGGARRMGQVALIGALLSTLAMAVGSVVTGMPLEADPSRLYYGTDTHAMGVLLGAALAVVWRPGRTSPVLRRQAQVVITLGGVLGLGLLGLAFTRLGEYSTFLYRGGFLLIAALSALVVAAASHRGVPFGAWLGNRPMRWIGRRSYGIYLWHWPLFLVTRPGVDIPLDGSAALFVRLALLLGVAELSYRYLELPVRRGALGRWWSGVRQGGVTRPSTAIVVAAVAVLLVGAGSIWRIAVAPPPAAADVPTPVVALPVGEPVAPLERDVERRAATAASPSPTSGASVAPPGRASVATPNPSSAGSSAAPRVPKSGRTEISAFGDSVLLGATPTLEARTFDVDLHARVGSQARAVEDAIRDVAKAGDLRLRVLIHTGTNGIVTTRELHGMLDAAKSADRVVISTVQVPRPWATPNNTAIRKVAAEYDNVVVADWAKVSNGHRDYFVKDGVHLTAAGAQRYNALIASAFGVALDPSGSS